MKKAKVKTKKKAVKKAAPVKKTKRVKAKKKAAKKATTKKAAKPVKKSPLMNFKAAGKDRKTLIANANKYAKGNLSAWLRFAGMKYVPPKNAVIG